jgi:hypothetical protein
MSVTTLPQEKTTVLKPSNGDGELEKRFLSEVVSWNFEGCRDPEKRVK